LAKHGPVDTLARLAEIDLVTTAAVLSPHDTLFLQRGSEEAEVRVRATLRTNNSNVIVNSLMTGRVAGPVQHLLVHDELEDGILVRILPEYEVRSHEIFMAYPSVRFMRPVVRAFTDFVVPRLKAVEGIDTLKQPPSRRDAVLVEVGEDTPKKPSNLLGRS
jgi:DNA-binding transcriptional LysR family regulator